MDEYVGRLEEYKVFLFIKKIVFYFWKGLRNLAIWDSQEWQETAHVKSYGVDTSPKCTKYIFPYENGSSLLIK